MTPSLRIGLLTPAVTGYNALDSGIGQHFADLAVGLVAEGHTVWVVTPAPADNAVRDPQLAGVRFEPFESKMPAWLDRLSGWRWQLHSLAGLRHRMHAASDALARCVARENLAIVETTSSGLFAARYLRRRPRARVVTRVSTTASSNAGRSASCARATASSRTRSTIGTSCAARGSCPPPRSPSSRTASRCPPMTN
jgi:hypothetical protein